MTHATGLIAEDEPLLADALQSELLRLWPELRVTGRAGDGLRAVQLAVQQLPDVVFLDIRMPGQSGLEAAAELLDQWPAQRPFPLIVFVTAYDQYAVQAFEAQAVDYLLKPVQPERLAKTVQRLQHALSTRSESAAAPENTLALLRQWLASSAPAHNAMPRLQVIQASPSGSPGVIHLVPIDEVLYFEAADKYVRVLTGTTEYLIRTPLKDLSAQLDPQAFWQVHRGTLVRASAIERVVRSDNGRLLLHIKGRAKPLPVSRLYAHLFKAM